MDLPITGGCMCGGVRYELSEPPEYAGYCHCTRCRRRSGNSASLSARVKPGTFRVTEGEHLIKAWRPPDGFEKAFCSECGSGLFSRNPDDPEQIGIRMGTFDSDPGVRASYRQWLSSAAPWEEIPNDGLPRHEEGRPA